MTTPSTVVSPAPTAHWHRPLAMLSIAVPFAASRVIGPWAAPIVPAAFGAACAVSIARRRPLLASLAAKRAASKPALAARIGAPGVADALATMTAVWAVVLLVEAAALAELASAHAAHFGTLNNVITWGGQAALVAVTIGYVRGRRLAGQATL